MSYQKLVIQGNVGRTPEIRYLPNGTAVTDISVAVDSGWGDKKETVWIKATCWNKLAEVVGQYVTKGSNVLVDGELKPVNVYTKNDGTTGASIEMTANTVRFLDKKSDNNGQAQESNSAGNDNDFADDGFDF